ncbi:MAG: MoaD/ThiS family protein [Chloroflexi bacterium]|nr:MoaD/ThiS family protein [Chloroflexota bacterium]
MNINFYASLRKISGQKTVPFDLPNQTTARELLDAVFARYPQMRDKLMNDDNELGLHAHMIVNGRDIPYLPDTMDTILSPNDKIDIFPIGHF